VGSGRLVVNTTHFPVPAADSQSLKYKFRVLNAAARLVCDARPREHVTSALIDLHWLPVAARSEFKICALAYQSLNSTAPAYNSDKLQPVSTLPRQTNLRSATNSELFIPRILDFRVAERAFSSAASRLWNALPTVSSEPPLLTFKKKLKITQNLFFPKHLC